jgi:RecB family exonuclease
VNYDNPSFLAELAKSLLGAHGSELKNIAVVLPNQRAGLFLRKELVRQSGKAIWSPEILTFDRLVSKLTGLSSIEETRSWVELYKVYRSIQLKEHDTFDEFMNWSTIALRHFNEVDAYLVDRQHFYDDIRSFEEIETWSLRNDPLSAQQNLLVERWHLHGRLHHAYAKELLSRGLAYNGLQERQLVDELRQGSVDLPWRKIWFAGLNALTRAEEKIIDLLRQAGIAELAWDVDLHYLHDRVHSAGLSVRKHIEHWGVGVIEPVNELRTKKRLVRIADVPNRMATIRFTVDQIVEMDPELRKKTTVVLTDTQLIGPLLDALPSSIGPVNVTMSVPLDKVPLAGFISQALNLAEQNHERQHFLRDSLLEYLSNPVIGGLVGDNRLAELREELDRNGAFVIPKLEADTALRTALVPKSHLLIDLICGTSIDKCPSMLLKFIDLIKEGREGTLLNEQAYQLAGTLKALQSIFEMIPTEDRTYRILRRIWQRMMDNTSLGLYGEPLEGLQIMGLLETRSIPLEHVIMLPANEGLLPPSAFERSFIPFDVRRAFDLPMRNDADAVITYHFYRALGSCSSMLLLVNGKEGHDAQAPSRFIDQIELELNHHIDNSVQTNVERVNVRTADRTMPERAFQVRKGDVVLERIKEKIKQGLSPSALNSYLTCPLNFYYRYVLRLKESDIKTADIQQSTLGSIFHFVMEHCYDPDKGEITTDRLSKDMQQVEQNFSAAIEAEKAQSHFLNERNRFPLFMAKKALLRLLQAEIRFMNEGGNLQIIAVEKEFAAAFPLPEHGMEGIIKGCIDRVEKRNGELWIIDIKTGSVKDADLKLDELTLDEIRLKGKALQLLAYAWTYLLAHPEVNEVNAAVLPARTVSSFPGIPLRVNGNSSITRNMLPELTNLFGEVIDSMINQEEVLQHDPESLYCAFCIEQETEKETEVSFS